MSNLRPDYFTSDVDDYGASVESTIPSANAAREASAARAPSALISWLRIGIDVAVYKITPMLRGHQAAEGESGKLRCAIGRRKVRRRGKGGDKGPKRSKGSYASSAGRIGWDHISPEALARGWVIPVLRRQCFGASPTVTPVRTDAYVSSPVAERMCVLRYGALARFVRTCGPCEVIARPQGWTAYWPWWTSLSPSPRRRSNA